MSNFSDIEFEENADPRAPTCIVLDCSDSMDQKFAGEARSPLEELNGALDVLVSEIHNDMLSRRRVELSFLPYGTHIAEPTAFGTIDNIVVPELRPMGITNTGAALVRALDHLEARKQEYKNSGIAYFMPTLYLLSDGLSMDDLGPATSRIQEMQRNKKLSFFAIGVEGADLAQLSEIGTRPALGLQGVKFGELFEWISQSAASVSASNPGDVVQLPGGLDAWATL